MAGYIGTKAALLSTTAASVGGDSTVGGDLTVDTDTLYVDSANNRVGIGNTSPTQALDVTGDIITSGGVYLGGTGAANYLDDYEEGTYTTYLSYGTTIVYGTNTGYYVKVGNVVTAYFKIEVTSMNNGDASYIHIRMPFNVWDNNTAVVVSLNGVASSLITQTSAGNSIGSGGYITNSVDLIINAQDNDYLKYFDCGTSGFIEGSATYMTT